MNEAKALITSALLTLMIFAPNAFASEESLSPADATSYKKAVSLRKERKYKEAALLFLPLAEKRIPKAVHNYAFCQYKQGDKEAAYTWYKQASDLGFKPSQRSLDSLLKNFFGDKHVIGIHFRDLGHLKKLAKSLKELSADTIFFVKDISAVDGKEVVLVRKTENEASHYSEFAKSAKVLLTALKGHSLDTWGKSTKQAKKLFLGELHDRKSHPERFSSFKDIYPMAVVKSDDGSLEISPTTHITAETPVIYSASTMFGAYEFSKRLPTKKSSIWYVNPDATTQHVYTFGTWKIQRGFLLTSESHLGISGELNVRNCFLSLGAKKINWLINANVGWNKMVNLRGSVSIITPCDKRPEKMPEKLYKELQSEFRHIRERGGARRFG